MEDDEPGERGEQHLQLEHGDGGGDELLLQLGLGGDAGQLLLRVITQSLIPLGTHSKDTFFALFWPENPSN